MRITIKLLFILLFLSFNANAQYTTVTNTTGTVLYGTTNVTVSGAGTASSYTTWCGAGPYWIGSGSGCSPTPGMYTYTFSPAVNAFRLFITAADVGCSTAYPPESISIFVNGTHYTLTAANLTTWASTCGTPPMVLSGDTLVASGGNSSGILDVLQCGITSVMVETDGVQNGTVYTFMFSDTAICSGATNNGPLCQGDVLNLHATGTSTDTYSWTGPNGFSSTLQDPTRTSVQYADTGIYTVTVNGSVIATTHFTIKPNPVLTASSNAPICSGADLIFTSGPDSTGETFSWTGPNLFTSTLENPIITAAVVADTGFYTVIATWNGCKDTAKVHVDIIHVSVPFDSTNAPICSDADLHLYARDSNASSVFSWSGPGGYTSALQNPVITAATTANAGIYTVTATVGACSQSDTLLVAINPKPPIPVIAPRPPVCSGVDVAFLVSNDTPGATYQWVGPNGFTSTVENLVITSVIRANAGNYSLTATYNGCSSEHTEVYLAVDSTPVAPTVSSNSPVCSDSVLRLFANDATAGVTYRWAGPALFTSTAQNPTIINAQTYMSGNYTVTATLYGVCSSATALPIVINQTPSLPSTAGTDTILCSGNLLHLASYSTPTTGTYYWSGPGGFSSVIQNPNILPAATWRQGNYFVYEIVNGCISEVAHVFVRVDSTPAVPLAWSNSPVCEGDTLKLFSSDSTPFVNYSWAGPSGFSAFVQNPFISNVPPAAAGVYTVTATLGLCSSSNFTSVSITSTPPLTAGSNSPVCTGDTLKLFATSTVGNTFFWTGPYTFMNTAPNPVRYPAVSEYAGVYTVTATEPGGCFHTVFDTVVIHQTPAPPWVPWVTYCQFFDAPQLTAVDAPNVLWYTTRVGGTGNSTPPVPTTNIPGIYFYYLTETMDGCTSARDSVQVVVHPKPIVTVDPAISKICPHESITFNATDIDPLVTYHWYPWIYLDDSTKSSVVSNPVADIEYSVVATSIYGCTDTAIAGITVYPAGVVSTQVSDSVSLSHGESYHITTQTNCTSLTWFPVSGLDNPNISDPTATPDVSTKYIVRGVTDHGCVAEDSIFFRLNGETLYGMANAFTPGTGVNNLFKLETKGIAKLNHFRIYNRWGQLMFETANISDGWDGMWKGQPQPFGVYVYDVQAVSSVTGKIINLQGNITLLR